MLSRIWNSAQGVLKPSAAPISKPQPGTPMATTRRKGVAATKLIDDQPSPNAFFTPAESRSAMKKRRRNASLESLEVPNTDSPGVKRQKLPAGGKDTDASMENTEDVAAESPKPVEPVAKPKSTHKRFDDDDAETTAPASDLVPEPAEAKNKDEDEEEDESSDDDAPEEVTVDAAAQTVKKAAREAARLREEEEAAKRKKRKSHDARLKQQAAASKKRELAEKSEEQQDGADEESTSRAKSSKTTLPAFLPLEYLESADVDADDAAAPETSRTAPKKPKRKVGNGIEKPRDRVRGSTTYRIADTEGKALLAPRAAESARRLKEKWLKERRQKGKGSRRAGSKKGFFVKK